MTTPNLADALQGLLDAGWDYQLAQKTPGQVRLLAWRRDEHGAYYDHRQLLGPDPAQLVLDLWAEVSGGKEGT